jgi:hypothetical protein
MGNEESQALVCLLFEPEYLSTLQNLYQWSIVGPDDIDEPKYLISKKLSEVRYRFPTSNVNKMADRMTRWSLMLRAA